MLTTESFKQMHGRTNVSDKVKPSPLLASVHITKMALLNAGFMSHKTLQGCHSCMQPIDGQNALLQTFGLMLSELANDDINDMPSLQDLQC